MIRFPDMGGLVGRSWYLGSGKDWRAADVKVMIITPISSVTPRSIIIMLCLCSLSRKRLDGIGTSMCDQYNSLRYQKEKLDEYHSMLFDASTDCCHRRNM